MNTVCADYIHYDNSDSAAGVAKLLGITKPGRHAIVIDVPADRQSIADMIVSVVLNDINCNGPISRSIRKSI